MTYWDMQVHPGSRREDFPVEKVIELIKRSGRIGMGDGWVNDLGQPDMFKNDMSVGDVVVVRDGGNIAALVEVAGECRKVPASERNSQNWFEIARDVKVVSFDVKTAERRYLKETGLAMTDGMSLRRTLNRCRKSEFARFWYVNVCQREERLFTWVPFYERLADRLLTYGNDHAALYKKLSQAFDDSGTGLVMPFNGRGKKFSDIDPFSVFAVLNRRLNEDKKRRLQRALGRRLDIDENSPSDFAGIPHADNRKAFFFPSKDDPKPFIDALWKMFDVAIAYADHPTKSNRADFIAQYDVVERQKEINRNLTMGLFWIRPNFYVGLDARNAAYIFDSGEFSASFVKEHTAVRNDVSSGARYLSFREEFVSALEKSRYKSIVSFSHQAYLSGLEYAQRAKSQMRRRSVEATVDEICRGPVKALLTDSKNGREFTKRIGEIYKARKVRAVLESAKVIAARGGERVIEARQRVNQSIFRDAVIETYGGRCCISGLPVLELLEACHIAGWSEDEEHRLSPDNGLCMAVIYHRAFDRHLIAIDENYRLKISPGLKREYPDEICAEFFYKYEGRKINVPEKYPPNKLLLANHRAMLKK